MSKDGLILLVILLALMVFGYIYFMLDSLDDERGFISLNKPVETEKSFDFANECTKMKSANWLGEYKECEMVDKPWCEALGGLFEECGSACRHMPEAEICTMQCVPFCKF